MPKNFVDFIHAVTKTGDFKQFNEFLRRCEEAGEKKNVNYLKEWFDKHPNNKVKILTQH